LAKLWRFTGRELSLLIVIGFLTALVDHRVELTILLNLFDVQSFVSLSNFLYSSTGGPILGDFLMAWEQYGGVLAAYLVRKPLAGTVSMTANGFSQVLLNGTHSPHLLYGVVGLGADVVYAAFGYSKYDFRASALAGLAAGMFWYPVVYFSHAVYEYPTSFIAAYLTVRALGNVVGDVLLGAGLGALALIAAHRLGWFEIESRTDRRLNELVLSRNDCLHDRLQKQL
jgi:energy-coupling factor transport system substrate-specific component